VRVSNSATSPAFGLEPAELRHGDYLIGTYIEADPVGATAVPGVWVAGNLTNLQAQVITAAAAGLAAGAAINYDLILEETGQATDARHATDGEPDRRATAGKVA
jgi:thioredoxin reductase